MDDPNAGNGSRARTVVRAISIAIGLALVAWALADDALIGGGPGFGATQAVVAAVGAGLLLACVLPLGWNARILALVVSSLFVLAVAEIGVRIVFGPRYWPANQLDDERLYRLVPGAVREFTREPVNGGARIVYRVNRDGYRGEPLEDTPERRVVVFGDSFIQAEYTELEQSFTERLEHHLKEASGLGVEVVNAGVAGYGPDQTLKRIEAELERLAPDAIVVGIFSGNDFGDSVRNKLFQLDEDGELVDHDFTLEPALARKMSVARQELLLKRVVRNVVAAFVPSVAGGPGPHASVEAMTPEERVAFFREQHIREYEEFVVQGDPVVRELAWDSYDADVSLTPSHPSSRFKIALMDRILARMKATADAAGIPMLLLPIPHPIDVGGHDSGAVDRSAFPEYRPRGLIDALEASASRHRIPFVDLYGPYVEQGPEQVYFRGFDDHWNDEGQDLAARIVARRLLADAALER